MEGQTDVCDCRVAFRAEKKIKDGGGRMGGGVDNGQTDKQTFVIVVAFANENKQRK